MAGQTDTRFKEFSKRVEEHRYELTLLLRGLKAMGHSIVGVSAPAKGMTLLNYCKIGTETLDYITERSVHKIGKFTPGEHIPIVYDHRLIEDQPDYALLLAWNFKDQIMKNNKGFKGKWIIPFPEVKIE